MIPDDRVFTDRMVAGFIDRVQESARRRFDTEAVWVRSERRGPSLKPYALRQLAIVRDGKVVKTAYCNRVGAVSWWEPGYGITYTIEDTPCQPPATLSNTTAPSPASPPPSGS